MEKQNPVTTPVQEKPQQELLTDEDYANLEKDPNYVSKLSSAKVKELNKMLIEQMDNPEPPPEPKKPEAKPEPSKAPEPVKETKEQPGKQTSEKKAEVKKLNLEKIKKLREQNQQLADEANRYEQKKRSLTERAAKAKREYEELAKKEVKVKDDDLGELADENIANIIKELRAENAKLRTDMDFFKKKDLSHYDEQVEEADKQYKDVNRNATFVAIEELQERYPDLQTKKRFDDIDKDYGIFMDNLVKKTVDDPSKHSQDELDKMRDTAYERYFNDDSYRKSLEAKGVIYPDSLNDKAEKAKYELILEMYRRSQEKGGSIKANWLEYLDEKGVLEDTLQKRETDAALEASRKTVAAMENNSPATTTPSDGPGTNPSAEGEITRPIAEQEIKAFTNKQNQGKRLTREERQRLNQIQEFLSKEVGAYY